MFLGLVSGPVLGDPLAPSDMGCLIEFWLGANAPLDAVILMIALSEVPPPVFDDWL